MEMKKIVCAALVATSIISVAAATTEDHHSAAPAPGPGSDGAISALPTVGSLVATAIFSFFAICMH
ncbi:hypothetical protein C2S51_022002 [Perilla frutescens var. frutescens]|nr:hypothetical protein C2S51_022002 [Perilla frutescens var. frutescens]